MIWTARSGNMYYRSTGELLDGDVVEHDGTRYKVTDYNFRDDRGERGYYWYYVTEVLV